MGRGDPTHRPHICFVAPETWPVLSGDPDIGVVGGAEVQQSILARVLVRAGCRVSMICLDYGQPRRTFVDGVEVHRAHAPDAGLPVLRFIHPRLTAIWRLMREIDADIYYQRSAAMLTAVVAAFCRRHGKRSIYAAASDTDFIPGRQIIRYGRDRWLFEQGLGRVDRIVAQNEQQRESCARHYGREALVIPSCYQTPADARPTARDCVLWVATLRPNKRPELFLEMARRMPDLRFVLIGGPANDPGAAAYFEATQRAARQLANVEFTGFLPLARVEPWFDRARVLVNTSVYEGMPNTFLQAWARGVPTLALLDVGARLDDEPVGCQACDLDDAASQLRRLFADEAWHARTSRRCRDYFATTHDAVAVGRRYEALLAELLENHR